MVGRLGNSSNVRGDLVIAVTCLPPEISAPGRLCTVTPADFGYLQPFRRYSRSKSEVVQNRPKFCMFLAPKFFGGSAPLIFGLAL